MASNTFGRLFCVTTFGESHGPAIGCVVDGCPPGLALSKSDFEADMERRRTGTSRHTSQRRESDRVQILSGVFEGLTTGAPIALLVENEDARPNDYGNLRDTFRPGHADYTWHVKYGHRDYRGGGRASARETAMRVAAGVIARKWLRERRGIQVRGWMSQMGPIRARSENLADVAGNPFFWPDASQVAELEDFMKSLRKSGDSVGARIEVQATGVPAGLGEPVYGKLDTELAAALMSINAAKGVEIGAGFRSVSQSGSEHRDEITPGGFLGNEAGGILGGISTGQPIRAAVAFKPASSLRLPARSVDREGREVEVVTKGRHDPCVGIRATPIVEAMVLLVLMDHVLRHRAQCSDVGAVGPVIPGGTPGAE